MKKIYLAGPCSSEHRTIMKSIADYLRKNVYCEVYCPFELKVENAWDMKQEEWAEKVFQHDIAALNECDYFVMISFGRIGSAGTNWEQGYAYALGKPIYVFQITDAPTSLMTYCGCTCFDNTNAKDVAWEVRQQLDSPLTQKPRCTTILT